MPCLEVIGISGSRLHRMDAARLFVASVHLKQRMLGPLALPRRDSELVFYGLQKVEPASLKYFLSNTIFGAEMSFLRYIAAVSENEESAAFQEDL